MDGANDRCGARFPEGTATCERERGHRGEHRTLLGAWEWPRETKCDASWRGINERACGALDANETESCRYYPDHEGAHSWTVGERYPKLSAGERADVTERCGNAAQSTRETVLTQAAAQAARVCDRAPLGWVCMREPAHGGPCAAYPAEEASLRRAAIDARNALRDAVMAQVWASTPRSDRERRMREAVAMWSVEVNTPTVRDHHDAIVADHAAHLRAFLVTCALDLRETDDHTGDDMSEARRSGNRLRRIAAWIQGDELRSDDVPAEPRIVLDALDAADELIDDATSVVLDQCEEEHCALVDAASDNAREELLTVRTAWVAKHRLEPSCHERSGGGPDGDGSDDA